jgi:plastocyanin
MFKSTVNRVLIKTGLLLLFSLPLLLAASCRSELDDPVPPVLPPNGEVQASPIPILTPTSTVVPSPTPAATQVLGGPGLPETGDPRSIFITDSQFDPPELTVSPGSTVIWFQNGAMPHTITADDGSFDSGSLESGQTYSQIFTESGRYPYHCELHGAPGAGMAGVIIVTDSDP